MDLELFIAYAIVTSMLLFILIYSVIHLISDTINTIDEHDDYDEKSN
jgi:hypothetical protein